MNRLSEKEEESIRFVAEHYKPGAFRRTRLMFSRPWWRTGWAAAAVAAVVLGASAAVITLTVNDRQPEPKPAPAPVTIEAPSPAQISVIEFKDAPLATVVKEVENVYGVKIANVPADPSLRLTLRYEGTAEDFIATVNDMLGTEMEVKR